MEEFTNKQKIWLVDHECAFYQERSVAELDLWDASEHRLCWLWIRAGETPRIMWNSSNRERWEEEAGVDNMIAALRQAIELKKEYESIKE